MRAVTLPLGELAEVVSGGTPKRSKPEFFGGAIPWVKIGDMLQGTVTDTDECITHAGLDHSSAKILPAGTILLSIFATIGRTAVLGIDAATNQAVAGLRIRDSTSVHPNYLRRYLESASPGLAKQGRGVAQANINLSILRAHPVPLPPIEEQRRIAAVLDAAEGLRAKRRQALAKLDSLTQAVFHDMFGDPVRNERGWPNKRLSDVVREGTTVTYGIVQAGDEFPGGIPYVRTGDISDGRIHVEGLRRTDPKIAERFPRSRVRVGEIVMSIRATVGTTAEVPATLDGANLTQGTARIAPSNVVIGDYLLEYLRSDAAQRWIQRQVKGATFREITLKRLRELPVMVPPLGEQQEFAVRRENAHRLRLVFESSLDGFDRLFASLQQRAFRGEL